MTLSIMERPLNIDHAKSPRAQSESTSKRTLVGLPPHGFILFISVNGCNRDVTPTNLNDWYFRCMEHRGIWTFFCILWFLLGAFVAVYPVRIGRLLCRKDELSPSIFSILVTSARMIG